MPRSRPEYRASMTGRRDSDASARHSITGEFVTTARRSANMARIRSRGNQSTELRVAAAFCVHGITGWRRHPKRIIGTPDFYFPKSRLAVFVDGCFWHACPRCGHIPKSNVEYWDHKIARNVWRDKQTQRALRKRDIRVLRLWEHELRNETWLRRLKRRLAEA